MGIKNSFLLYTDYKQHIDLLSLEEKGQLLDAIFNYAEGNEIELDGMAKMAFSFIRAQMDRDNENYEKTCEARREAGSKGGKAKVANAKQDVAKVANAKFAKQRVANQADTENDTDNENDTVTDTENETDIKSPTETKKKSKKEKASPTLSVEQMQDIVLQSELSCQVQDKVRDWIEYKHQRNEPYKDMGFKSLITQIGKHEREAGADAVCDCIDLCMSNEWKGIIWEKLQRQQPQRAAPGERIDWDKV